MSTASYKSAHNAEQESERHFYERYAWCLNPLQPLDQLFVRLRDELEWYPALEVEWQQQEARINLYLLTCAIHCTVSDYLGPHLPSFAKLAERWPFASLALGAAGKAALAAKRMQSAWRDGTLWSWHQQWTGCVELACGILLNELGAQSPQTVRLASLSRELAGRELPESLRCAPMQIMSGFRAQDLTHYDAIALADAFDSAQSTREGCAGNCGRAYGGHLFCAADSRQAATARVEIGVDRASS